MKTLLALLLFCLTATTVYAFEYPALGSERAQQEYQNLIMAWQDTCSMPSLEPGAIDFTGGEVPINTAFNKGE